MPCFRPVPCFRGNTISRDTGKRNIVYSPGEAFVRPDGTHDAFSRGCGQCRFCRMEHSRQFAMRAVLESSLYPNNCFLTLTYAPEHLPAFGFLDYEAPVLFMKRLRRWMDHHHPFQVIRSYGCAEYGEDFNRPHYHLCIFNFDFPDKVFFKTTDSGEKIFTSEILSGLWKFGHSSIGDLTFESAAYVARYVCKKISTSRLTPPHLREHYLHHIDEASGEMFYRPPERSVCVPKRVGLGRSWFDLNGDFVRTHDFVVIRGQKMRPPKYFDRLMEKADPQGFAEVKAMRKERGEEVTAKMEEEDHVAFVRNFERWRHDDFHGNVKIARSRLTVMEEVEELKYRQFNRGFENE